MKRTLSGLLSLVVLAACTQNPTSSPPASKTTAPDSIILNQASADVYLHPEYAKAIARFAYVWAYPMVNMLNRGIMLSKAPEPGRLGGIVPVAPTGKLSMLTDYIDPGQSVIACPNQDVVYGLSCFLLDEQPLVIQVPDFGDRFWVFAIYDMRTDEVGELGRPYGSKPGFYLVKGPHWKGQIPAGITGVIECPTARGNFCPRVFMDDTPEDRAAIQPLINQIVVYPLKEFDGKMKTVDWKNTPEIPNPAKGNGEETQWVVPEKFFDQLAIILKTIKPLPGEEAMYSQFHALLVAADKSPEIKRMIIAEVAALDKSLIKDFLQWKYNGKPAGNNWNRSQHNAQWGLDYYNRLGTSKSNMFDNRPNETQYYYTDYTTDGQKLQGKNNYKLTFKELPPVNGFWSLTMYNEHHFFYANSLKRFSLGTKNKNLKYNEDGSLTLYAGNKNPGSDKESNWLPAPVGDFSLYIRAYWGKEEITQGTWIPPVVEKY